MDSEIISKACKSACARFMKVCEKKVGHFEHLLQSGSYPHFACDSLVLCKNNSRCSTIENLFC